MFNNSNGGYSLADIAAATGNGRDDGFGGNGGAWWIIILFLFAFAGGWGNRGWGNGGGAECGMTYVPYAVNAGGGGAVTRSDLCSEFNFNNLTRSVNGIANGICDSTYALNSAITSGNAAAQNTMTQGFAGLNTAIQQNGYESRLATQTIGSQLQSCCCDLQNTVNQGFNNANIAMLQGFNGVTAGQNTLATQIASSTCDLGNRMATAFATTDRTIERGFCDTQYRDATNTTAIMQNAHNDTDRILAKLADMESARQAEKIADLQAENQGLRLAASQSA